MTKCFLKFYKRTRKNKYEKRLFVNKIKKFIIARLRTVYLRAGMKMTGRIAANSEIFAYLY